MKFQSLKIVKEDPYLEPFEGHFNQIQTLMKTKIDQFQNEGGLKSISQSYLNYGLHSKGNLIQYRQWAPSAHQIHVFGQFNNWNRSQYPCLKNQFGTWTCTINQSIKPFTKIKCEVQLKDHSIADRIPAWINYTIQNEDKSYDGLYVQLGKYHFKNAKPKWENNNLRIYQCHIGMSGIQQKVHTFNSFSKNVLPRIIDLGYNTIQIMGIMQHPYYGSFGYHVSNFFSVSSRFGQPEDFKRLVDEAHKYNIKIIIDIVHSHAAKNVSEGINLWDGTDYQYFHEGAKGQHPLWDSRVFDYSKYEVLRFLLSNIRFWLDEYNVDGFRFDGVTSMLYSHHGSGYGFTGNYHEYFNDNLDLDSVVYIMMANKLATSIYPEVILIAEDVSGIPGLCRTIEDGGFGFNFRLAMAIPDLWIKLLKQVKDQQWDIEKIVYELNNHRDKQKTISYAESHDQALVGDKTLSMWLFDAEIYTNMSLLNEQSMKVFRGMALHKMIRLLTFSLGCQGYLNFMGNQFGHPEWIDFPRQGNNWSYQYCRRRWDLSDNQQLRYHQLNNFDKSMLALDIHHNVLNNQYQYIRHKHNEQKVIVYQKGYLLFVFNWHCSTSYQQYIACVRTCTSLKVIMSSDDKQFGGHGRVAHQSYVTTHIDEFLSKFVCYLPNRCAIVFKVE